MKAVTGTGPPAQLCGEARQAPARRDRALQAGQKVLAKQRDVLLNTAWSPPRRINDELAAPLLEEPCQLGLAGPGDRWRTGPESCRPFSSVHRPLATLLARMQANSDVRRRNPEPIAPGAPPVQDFRAPSKKTWPAIFILGRNMELEQYRGTIIAASGKHDRNRAPSWNHCTTLAPISSRLA